MGRGTNPAVRETPLPTPIRTYGASILGFLAHTKLDTRHPLSKILDPPLGRICHFGDIQRQRMADLEIWVWCPSRSSRMARFDRPCMTLFVPNYNYSTILYYLRVI